MVNSSWTLLDTKRSDEKKKASPIFGEQRLRYSMPSKPRSGSWVQRGDEPPLDPSLGAELLQSVISPPLALGDVDVSEKGGEKGDTNPVGSEERVHPDVDQDLGERGREDDRARN